MSFIQIGFNIFQIINACMPLFVVTVETLPFVFMPTASCIVYYAAVPGGISFISIIFIISTLITAFNYIMKSNILITESTLSKEKGQIGA